MKKCIYCGKDSDFEKAVIGGMVSLCKTSKSGKAQGKGHSIKAELCPYCGTINRLFVENFN